MKTVSKGILIIAASVLLAACIRQEQGKLVPQNCENIVFSGQIGAVGDGTTLNTQVFQAALDSLAAMGGGCLVLAPGQYLCGMLRIGSDTELFLEQGAVLMGSTNPYDYENTTRKGARGDEDVKVGLITARGVANVKVRGNGTIDARGLALALAIDSLHHTGQRIDPAYNYKRMRPTTRPKLFSIEDVIGLKVEGLNLRNSAGWGLSVDKSCDIELCHLKITNRAYWNNDGIDLNDCHRAEIHHCDINSADDGICLKSDDPKDCCSDIHIHDCRIASSSNAVKTGTASYGGFRNIRIENITVYDTFRSAIALESVDGAIMENITVDGVNAVNTGNPFFICLGHRNGDNPGAASNITIRNLCAQVPFGRPDLAYDLRGPEVNYFHNPWPSSISGLPGCDIENVTLENIEITYPGRATKSMAYVGLYRANQVPEAIGKYPEFTMYGELPCWALYLRHINGIALRNVIFHLQDEDFRPAMLLDDVKSHDIQGLTLPDGMDVAQHTKDYELKSIGFLKEK